MNLSRLCWAWFYISFTLQRKLLLSKWDFTVIRTKHTTDWWVGEKWYWEAFCPPIINDWIMMIGSILSNWINILYIIVYRINKIFMSNNYRAGIVVSNGKNLSENTFSGGSGKLGGITFRKIFSGGKNFFVGWMVVWKILFAPFLKPDFVFWSFFWVRETTLTEPRQIQCTFMWGRREKEWKTSYGQ